MNDEKLLVIGHAHSHGVSEILAKESDQQILARYRSALEIIKTEKYMTVAAARVIANEALGGEE